MTQTETAFCFDVAGEGWGFNVVTTFSVGEEDFQEALEAFGPEECGLVCVGSLHADEVEDNFPELDLSSGVACNLDASGKEKLQVEAFLEKLLSLR